MLRSCLFLLILFACAHPSCAHAATFYVTVVSHFDRPWAMRRDDLTALRSLTNRHPQMRWTHLYNPAAYTQPTPLREAMEAFVLESKGRHGAEIGVHLHMHASFVRAAGVEFRDRPSLTASRVAGSRDETGYAVPMTAYKRHEMRAMLDWTIAKFEERKLGRPRSFCAGFYATSLPLQESLVAKGFGVSAAAFPTGDRFGRKYAPAWESLSGWDETVRHTTRPYRVSTRTILPGGPEPFLQGEAGPLLEVPQTCKIDWMVSLEDMKAVFRDHLELAQAGVPAAICLAIHEENAADHEAKYDDMLSFVDTQTRVRSGVRVRYATLSELRAQWLKRQPTPESTREAARRLRKLGGTLLTRGQHVNDIRLSGTEVTDDELQLVAGFRSLTDLSLENTSVGNAGMAYLTSLQRLEWLNLYRTKLGDRGLKFLSYLPRLEHLPAGDTELTDAGLSHLKNMRQLKYLGLRGTKIGDAGLVNLTHVVNLTGLHLGETRVTDEGLRHLAPLTKLKKLWLHDTGVTDAAIEDLAALSQLEDLYVYRSHLTLRGIQQLRKRLPNCRVHYRSATESPEKQTPVK